MDQLIVAPMNTTCVRRARSAAGMSWRISPRSCASKKMSVRIRLRNLRSLHQFVADGLAGGMRRKNRPQKSGAHVRLARGVSRQFPHHVHHRLVGGPGFFQRALYRGHAFTAKFGQDMLFGGEIIEERPLADIGGFSDVLHGGFQESTLREQIQRGTVQAVARLRAVSLAASAPRGAFCMVGTCGWALHRRVSSRNDLNPHPTIGQVWTEVKGSPVVTPCELWRHENPKGRTRELAPEG